MKKRYYKVTGFCKDCTGIDFQGCNDGQPFNIGNYTTEDFAFEAGYEFVGDSPYYFNVEILEIEFYLYETLTFEK